jgi:transcriptional regulator with XRE-family HTH domain
MAVDGGAQGVTTMTDDSEGPAIGERLKQLRTAHGISLRELGRRADLSASFLSELERGIVEPSISALKRIATALDVRLEYFFSDPQASEASGYAVIRHGAGRKLTASGSGVTPHARVDGVVRGHLRHVSTGRHDRRGRDRP